MPPRTEPTDSRMLIEPEPADAALMTAAITARTLGAVGSTLVNPPAKAGL